MDHAREVSSELGAMSLARLDFWCFVDSLVAPVSFFFGQPASEPVFWICSCVAIYRQCTPCWGRGRTHNSGFVIGFALWVSASSDVERRNGNDGVNGTRAGVRGLARTNYTES